MPCTFVRSLVSGVVFALSRPVAAEPPEPPRVARDPVLQREYRLSYGGLQVVDARRGHRLADVALPGWVVARPPYACPPALAVGPGGEVVVTSNVLPILWRLDARTLLVTVHSMELAPPTSRDVGFAALHWEASLGAWRGTTEQGESWRIDAGLRGATFMGAAAGAPRCARSAP